MIPTSPEQCTRFATVEDAGATWRSMVVGDEIAFSWRWTEWKTQEG